MGPGWCSGVHDVSIRLDLETVFQFSHLVLTFKVNCEGRLITYQSFININKPPTDPSFLVAASQIWTFVKIWIQGICGAFGDQSRAMTFYIFPTSGPVF